MSHSVSLDDLSCPAPQADYARVLLGHGSGGTLSADLLRRVFLAELDNSVRILDTDENRRWVITEKLDGHLGQKLRGQPLPSNLVRSVLLQGLIGLQSSVQ